MEVLKVSARSNPNSVAGALAGVLREKGGAEIQAIGAGALNQAVKAIAIARGFVAPGGIEDVYKRQGEGELFQTEGYRDIGEAISAGRAVGHGAGAVCVAADRSHIQHHRRADGESVRREYGVIVFR